VAIRHDQNLLFGRPKEGWDGKNESEIFWIGKDGQEYTTSTMQYFQIESVREAQERQVQIAHNLMHRLLQKNAMTMATPDPDKFMDEEDAQQFITAREFLAENRPLLRRLEVLASLQTTKR
jgi:hypothetical protein